MPYLPSVHQVNPVSSSHQHKNNGDRRARSPNFMFTGYACSRCRGNTPVAKLICKLSPR
jgi:hypothetical protein